MTSSIAGLTDSGFFTFLYRRSGYILQTIYPSTTHVIYNIANLKIKQSEDKGVTSNSRSMHTMFIANW